ncbi:hypothetical protein ACFP3I_10435 [Chryseobacterium arachidis]
MDIVVYQNADNFFKSVLNTKILNKKATLQNVQLLPLRLFY